MKVGSSDETTTPAVAHEALRLQQPKRLQHRLARDIQPLRKLVLGDALAGRQLAIADRIENGAIDAIGKRQVEGDMVHHAPRL
jgi:hypothetical protein